MRFVVFVAAISCLSIPLLGHVNPNPQKSGQDKQCQTGSLLNQVQQTALLISDQSQKDYVLGELTELRAKVGDFSGAFQSAASIQSQLRREDEIQRVVLIRAESGDWKGAREDAEKLSDGSKKYTLQQIAITQAKAGDVQGALKFASDLGDNAKEAVLEVEGESQAEAGDIASAAKTAEAMSNQDEVLWVISTVQAKQGDVQGALATGLRVKDEGMRNSIPVMVASTRAEVGDFAGASHLLNKLRSFDRVGVLLDIAKQQAKAGNKLGASSTLEEAVRTAATIRDASTKGEELSHIATAQIQVAISPTALVQIEKLPEKEKKAAFVRLGGLLLQAGQPEDALKFLERTNDVQMIALAKAQKGDVEGALVVIKSESNPGNISYWISEIVVQKAERGDIAGALKLAPKIRIRNMDYEEGYLADALRKAARAQVKTGDLAGTLTWVNAESSPYVRADALLGVIEGIRDLCR